MSTRNLHLKIQKSWCVMVTIIYVKGVRSKKDERKGSNPKNGCVWLLGLVVIFLLLTWLWIVLASAAHILTWLWIRRVSLNLIASSVEHYPWQRTRALCVGLLAGWPVSWLVGWLIGWLVGWFSLSSPSSIAHCICNSSCGFKPTQTSLAQFSWVSHCGWRSLGSYFPQDWFKVLPQIKATSQTFSQHHLLSLPPLTILL